MSDFKNVLVVIDPTEDTQKALSRALELAEKQPIRITLFLTIYDFSYEMTTMLSSDERQHMRDAVIADRESWLLDLITHSPTIPHDIKTKVVWHNRPYESIIRTVIEGNYDLVIKGTHSHDTLKSVIFTPTDWHLLRKCPCALLLVKEHEWPEHGKVLAAVSAGTEDDKHQELNDRIIGHGKHIAELLESDTHLINAYPPTPVNIAVEIPEFDPNEYNSTMKQHHLTSMEALANKHEVPNTRCHVVEGMAEDVIPRVANDLDAELVVMGTVGRLGITAALIGNTAEHVIDNINCDLLAIKPSDFVCPVKL
ncbi:universal stress protein UspE [Psychrosphaera aestuarii]|uniref:universal stress protein UspE n=1 Tax=Psychrosphaera aestuarii TaxID=1266052 RepID=UPI001B337EBD|nr:universal stress protein UspE [Psychrosphaera aestuarii]